MAGSMQRFNFINKCSPWWRAGSGRHVLSLWLQTHFRVHVLVSPWSPSLHVYMARWRFQGCSFTNIRIPNLKSAILAKWRILGCFFTNIQNHNLKSAILAKWWFPTCFLAWNDAGTFKRVYRMIWHVFLKFFLKKLKFLSGRGGGFHMPSITVFQNTIIHRIKHGS